MNELTLEGLKELQKMELDWDWEKFRREAAKEILCASINGGIARGVDGFVAEKKILVKGAIEVADELVKQLKEE